MNMWHECFRFPDGPEKDAQPVIPGEDPESKRICDMNALDSPMARGETPFGAIQRRKTN